MTGPGSTHCWGSPRRASPARRPGPSRGARNWSTPGTHTRRQPVLSSLLGLNREAPDEAESAANLPSLRHRRRTESKRTCVGHGAGDWGAGGACGSPWPWASCTSPWPGRVRPSLHSAWTQRPWDLSLSFPPHPQAAWPCSLQNDRISARILLRGVRHTRTGACVCRRPGRGGGEAHAVQPGAALRAAACADRQPGGRLPHSEGPGPPRTPQMLIPRPTGRALEHNDVAVNITTQADGLEAEGVSQSAERKGREWAGTGQRGAARGRRGAVGVHRTSRETGTGKRGGSQGSGARRGSPHPQPQLRVLWFQLPLAIAARKNETEASGNKRFALSCAPF